MQYLRMNNLLAGAKRMALLGCSVAVMHHQVHRPSGERLTKAYCQQNQLNYTFDAEAIKEIEKIKATESEMRLRWIRDEDNFRKLPARAWPPVQPNLDDIPNLKAAVAQLCPKQLEQPDSPLPNECEEVVFNLATSLVFNNVDAKTGYQLYNTLAERGNTDGMTAAAICLLEVVGVDDSDNERGAEWLRRAYSLSSAQGTYELGVLYYTGLVEPHVPLNEEIAFKLFSEAAALADHTSATYMIAYMLLRSEGCQPDVARAIKNLYAAGEKGHRSARAALLNILDTYNKTG